MNVTEALMAQAIGSIDRQVGNAVRLAKHQGKVLALSPAELRSNLHSSEPLARTVSLSHDYMLLDPGVAPPAGWVIVDGEEEV